MKTLKGIETYGCFAIGKGESFARSLYGSLEGEDHIAENSVITIDLIKRENGIPYPLDLRHCSYAQLSKNVGLITREMFKRLNLEG